MGSVKNLCFILFFLTLFLFGAPLPSSAQKVVLKIDFNLVLVVIFLFLLDRRQIQSLQL